MHAPRCALQVACSACSSPAALFFEFRRITPVGPHTFHACDEEGIVYIQSNFENHWLHAIHAKQKLRCVCAAFQAAPGKARGRPMLTTAPQVPRLPMYVAAPQRRLMINLSVPLAHGAELQLTGICCRMGVPLMC